LNRESEVVAADASDVRRRADTLIDDVVQMAVDAVNGLSLSLSYLLI